VSFKSHIAERASQSSSGSHRCHVPGCGRPTQRSAAKGLSELYCKVHVEFHRRHGSYWRRSFLGWELAPYRTSARRWIRSHRQESLTAGVVSALDQLLAGAGQTQSAYDLRGMNPTEKARIALARVHDVGADGARLLEIALSVAAKVDQDGPHDPEFRDVQIAKLVHRLASGTHRSTSGFPMPSKYPPSAGRVLRILGNRIWDIAALVADDDARREVVAMARHGAALAEKRAAKRALARETVAREIERAKQSGMGPQRLARYRLQLQRQYGAK
jgi:hypothetical protein